MEFNLMLDLMVIMDLAVQPKKPTRFKRWECHVLQYTVAVKITSCVS